MSQNTFSHGYALLIGVGADLPVTVEDATAIHNILVDPSRAAYPSDHVKLLTETAADRKNILNVFDQFIQQVNSDPEATVIIYFSGHGIKVQRPQETPGYYLVPHGFQWKRLAETTISSQEFTAKIEAIKARKMVVLLDCCHAGGIPALKDIPEVTVKSWPTPPDLLHALEAGSGHVVIASSLENESSYTGVPYSVFTACLLEAMAGKAAISKDGFARILDILRYLFDNVPVRAANAGPQHPFVNKIVNLDENFALCYYAGGSKDIPGEIMETKPTALTTWQQTVIKQRIEELEQSRNMRAERVRRVQKAFDIEDQPLSIFKYEQQLLQEKAVLQQINDELEELNRRLQ